MPRPKLVPSAELRDVLKELADGDLDVFGKLQPRLYNALPIVQQRADERPTIIVPFDGTSTKLEVLQAVAKAASRGLALISRLCSSSSTTTSSSSSRTSSLLAYRQALLCMARCCEALSGLIFGKLFEPGATMNRAAQLELAVALQSTGALQL
jgi:hypothetical protein